MEKNQRDPVESLNFIGGSDEMQKILETVRQVAPTSITVLISGESGSGKEMIAKIIHRLSPRNEKPMLTVNCGAIPEGLLESELFGHEKGAFTGAVESKKGYFELAAGGTLFLDEIGEMSLATQVKLLRVLEEKEYMRVGGSEVLLADVRIIAATNKDLQREVERGDFRRDLYYRINAVHVDVPPLRRRKADIRDLAVIFAREVCAENSIQFRGFTSGAFRVLEEYSWPGNVRELKNTIERIMILNRGERIDGEIVEKSLPPPRHESKNLPVALNKPSDQAERELIYRALIDIRMVVEEIRSYMHSHMGGEIRSLDHPVHFDEYDERREEDAVNADSLDLKEHEEKLVRQALNQFGGNRKQAAEALGIGERTLYRKIKEYGLG